MKNIPYQRFNTLLINIVCFLVVNAEKIVFIFSYLVHIVYYATNRGLHCRNTNLYKLYKYLQHFILFHVFHLLTENQLRECRAKENQVLAPSKVHVQLQWFELADESSEYWSLAPCGCFKKKLETNFFIGANHRSGQKSYWFHFGTQTPMREITCHIGKVSSDSKPYQNTYQSGYTMLFKVHRLANSGIWVRLVVGPSKKISRKRIITVTQTQTTINADITVNSDTWTNLIQV